MYREKIKQVALTKGASRYIQLLMIIYDPLLKLHPPTVYRLQLMKVLIVLIVADAYQDRFPVFTSAYDKINALTTFDRHAICAFYLHGKSSPFDDNRPLDKTGKFYPLQLPFFLLVVGHRSSHEEPSSFLH